MAKFDFAGWRRRGASVWAGFTSGQKTMLGLALVGALIGFLLFSNWAGQPSYTALYSNLPAGDASSITEELASKGIKYRLADGGATVMVPRQDVYQTRLDLSAQGLPAGGSPGYALLDKQGITTSEFRQRVDFQRALEGELARTIGAIDGVESADVHLVIPADDLFTDDASKPSASVLLHGARGVEFAPGQVRAIVHLVASSVEGLQPESVTVADGRGKVLSAPGEDGSAATGDVRSAQTADFEAGLSGSLEQMLAPVTGAGGAVVRVKASLDFDERSVVTERFDQPQAPATTAPVLSESTATEQFTGSGAGAAAGVLGTDGAAAGAAGTPNDYKKDQAERTFAVGKVTEQVKSAPGQVERLSVAVLLDTATKADPAQISALVSAAAGLDPARGDVIEVRPLAFDRSADAGAEKAAKSAESAESKAKLMGMVQAGGVVLLVLVILFLAWRSARKATVTRSPVSLPAGYPHDPRSAALHALEQGRETGPGAPLAPAAVNPVTALSLGGGVAPVVEIPAADEIGDLIDRQPDEVAQVLRGWLADRRS